MLSDGSTRAELAAWLRRDVMGPFNGADERIRARPSARYIVGALHPAFTPQAAEETDEAFEATGDDENSDAAAAYGGMRQSAMGISFSTALDSKPIVTVSFAEYDPVEILTPDGKRRDAIDELATSDVAEEARIEEDEEARQDQDRRPHNEWQRREIVLEVAPASTNGAEAIADGIILEWRSAETEADRVWTVSLVNRRPAKSGESVFQPTVRVRLLGGADFRARPPVSTLGDPDEELNRLLYRATPEYAVGHGCAAAWHEGGVVQEVWTDLVPIYQIKAVKALSATAAELRMDALAKLTGSVAVETAMRPLLDEYARWIDEIADEVSVLDSSLGETAERNLKSCRDAEQRMRSAISLMADDPDALMAFKFMNLAMADQRRASLEAAHYRATGTRSKPEEIPAWRPFQLAFILLNLVGLARADSPDRQLVDLLWFPTGGGKTEAYLGLAAFAIGYRRLTIGARDIPFLQGVTVLTRYTLRLLTTQQFERAAALVASCELLRRKKPALWGNAPMSIGLWVGEGASPNTFDAAVQKADEARRQPNSNQSHPFVLRNCPWCGQGLPFPSAFALEPASRKLTVTCTYGGCPFSKHPGLPVQVIDEQVYREPPEILLATVDKLARLPWVGESASLFGRAANLCGEHGYFATLEEHRRRFGKACEIAEAPTNRGVELVIQDELHLISGPLGSLVGLYEIAAEFLAGRSGDPPKVVASTATIRSATDQVRALYGRMERLFPPPALNAFDTFFAQPAAAAELPGRLYVGLTAPGTSMKTALIRTYSSLLAGVLALSTDEKDDAYWTLVGYFNSLRELGGAVSFLQDDIPSRLAALARAGDYPKREDLQYEELTSRIPSAEIPDRLRRMEQPRAVASALDVLVATNMISVGVDVERLGLMVVAGQPKGTAEYIQATSRVGRSYPGLVVTAYNWTRPRDLSHYESFQTYHSAIYRHVEATSVTPLSPRARDRGLHAVLVAALRLADNSLTGEDDASLIDSHRYDPIAIQFLDAFRLRAQATEPGEAVAAEEQLVKLLDQWGERATSGDLAYSRGAATRLLKPAQSGAQEELHKADPDAWPTLNSLRNVESEHAWFDLP
jgi:hypothetical protein